MEEVPAVSLPLCAYKRDGRRRCQVTFTGWHGAAIRRTNSIDRSAFCRREEAVNIDILAVGKLRESFWREASQEYCKRLGRYAKIQICEAEEVKKPDVIPPGLEKQILEKEAERLRKFYKNGAYRIALAIDGQMLDSVQLSEKLENCMLTGHDTVQFIIGGAIGLDPSLLREADLRLSFSKMTFPHQLMRVILLEQVYRSFRIMRGEPYHK